MYIAEGAGCWHQPVRLLVPKVETVTGRAREKARLGRWGNGRTDYALTERFHKTQIVNSAKKRTRYDALERLARRF